MKNFYIIMILIFSGGLIIADTIDLQSIEKSNRIALIESSSDYCKIEYITCDVEKELLEIDGALYNILRIDDESTLLSKGMPDLPKITRSISISSKAKMNFRILESEYQEIPMDVAPSKGSFSRNVNPDTIPYEFSNVYTQDDYYPYSIVELGSPYIFRDHRGITINLYPVTYNPVKKLIRVYTKVVLEISNEKKSESFRSEDSKKSDKTFDEIYKHHFLNQQSSSSSSTPLSRYADVSEQGSMLVICYDKFMKEMQPFIDWKNLKGIPTSMVGVSQIGNNEYQIKNYIYKEYTSGNLSFVLFVGDNEQVPSFIISDTQNGLTQSDANYALLVGDDSYPEIIVGRFSAETSDDVRTQVNKTIFYERDMGNEAWRYKAIGYASDEGPGDDHEMDYQHMRNIRSDLLKYNYTHVDEFYAGSQGGADAYGEPSISMGQNAINEGRGLINYIGHGDYYRWDTGGFNIFTVGNLKNTNKLPVIFSVACTVGAFGGRTCFSESWLRAGNESNHIGAAAMYGASIYQPWYEPMRAQDEFVDLMVSETKASFGALCYMASSKMLDEGGRASITFKGWNIFGDPSLEIRYSEEERTPTPRPFFLGDTNSDGKIDIVDCLLIAQYYVGLKPENFDPLRGDVICNGYTDIVDAMLIAQYYVGLIDSFYC